MKKNMRTIIGCTIILNSFLVDGKENDSIEQGYQNYSNFFAPLRSAINGKSIKNNKSIDFIPDPAFGGTTSRGIYVKKDRTADIYNGDKSYHFTKIITQRTNENLVDPEKKPANTVRIGSFSSKMNHAKMPVTTYVFGVLTVLLEKKEDPAKQSTTDQSSTQQPTEKTSETYPSMPGSNPATYAPIQFRPSEEFIGNGLIGNFFKTTGIATIHDPSGTNKQSYTFINVQTGGTQTPDGTKFIGSYTQQPKCHGTICPMVVMMVNLYGNLQPEEESHE